MVINSEQQRVIDELDRNILLLASAGTGKRIQRLIEWLTLLKVARCGGTSDFVHDLYK